MPYDFKAMLAAPDLATSLNILARAAGYKIDAGADRMLANEMAPHVNEGLALNRAYMSIESAETRQALLDVLLAIEARLPQR